MTRRPSAAVHRPAPMSRGAVRASCLAALALLVLLPSTAQAGIYWTNGHSFSGSNGVVGTEIGRANLDGSNADRYWLDADTNASDIEVVDGTLLWVEGPTISRARPGGRPEVLVRLPDDSCEFVCDLAVVGDTIYWSDSSSEYLGRVGLDGSAPDPTWFRPEEWYEPGAIATDGRLLYLELGGTLMSVDPTDPAGTLREVAADPGMGGINALATTGGYLYYAGHSTGDDFEDHGHIGRVPVSGGTPDPLWFDQDHGAPTDPYWDPVGLAADATHVYYTSFLGSHLDSGVIGRVRVADRHADLELVADGSDLFSPWAIAVDASAVPPPPNGVQDVRVRAPRRVKVGGRTLKVPVTVRAGAHDVEAVWRGRVRLGGRSFPLRTQERVVRSGASTRRVLGLGGRADRRRAAERLVRQRLRSGRKVTVSVVVRLRDVHDHRRTVRATVRLR